MTGQNVLYVAMLAILLAGLPVPQASAAVEPGACDNVMHNCSSCLALAPNCSWFVCPMDAGATHCANTTTGAEGCFPVNATDCADGPDVPTTTVDPPTTTVDPPTTTEDPEPSTTEFPTTVDPATTTEPPTEPPTTTTESPTTTEPPTEPPTTESPTTELPTTEPPTEPTTTESPTETPTTTPTDPTTTVEPAPTPAPSPAPRTGGFSFGSFVGGMVFCLVILAGGFIGLKIYRRRQAMAGRYNNLWGNDAERMHLTI